MGSRGRISTKRCKYTPDTIELGLINGTLENDFLRPDLRGRVPPI